MPLLAVVESYQFADPSLRERYHQFVDELRCPKCQNQNLSGSNSEIASDLRRELHRLLHEDKSDKEIVDYMVARYGEFVLYKPPLNKQTLLLWFAPGLLLVIGIVVLLVIVTRQRQKAIAVNTGSLSKREQAALDALLKENGLKDDELKEQQLTGKSND
jgi:cytochrome c-type biogenesis protein CcmH